MRKEIEVNKINLKVFYAKEKDYSKINSLLNAMEEENIILSWNIDHNNEYDISYLDHNNKDFILDTIESNKKLGFKMISYKEKGILNY